MVITLYTIKKRRNSTQLPTYAGVNHNGTLRANCSVITPAVAFAQTGSAPTAFNYAYIPVFGRYYFINNWTYAAGQWLAEMSEDTLASWRAQIGSSTQYIERAAAEFDGDILDNFYPAKTDPVSSTIYDDKLGWALAERPKSYVLGISGQDAAISYYALTPAQYTALGNILLGNIDWIGAPPSAIEPQVLKAFFNPMQYISSIYAYPFEVTGAGDYRKIKFGWWDPDIYGAHLVKQQQLFISNFTLPKHPQAAARGSYLNTAPFSRYTINYPCFGTIPLDTQLIRDAEKIQCRCVVDVARGTALFMIYADFVLLYRATGKVGVPWSLSQQISNNIAAVPAVYQAAKDAATGNIIGTVSGITSAVSAAAPQIQSAGSEGSFSEFLLPPALTSSFYNVVDEDNIDHGRPLCKLRKVSSLPGYQIIQDPQANFSCTADEQDQIKSFMEGGFYYE